MTLPNVPVSTTGVLAFLARRMPVSEENLATEALTFVLGRSPAARQVLRQLASTLGADLDDDLSFVGQVGHPDTGRPDIVGQDSNRRERLLIEAKFAAALTENQPAAYLTRLPTDVDGMLLVVAPEARRASLWSELVTAWREALGPAPAPSTTPGGMPLTMTVGSRTLALVSWRSLVAKVLGAVDHSGDRALAEDVRQLLSLTEVMDAAAFIPFQGGDLDLRAARQVRQLEQVIDRARGRITAEANITPFGRSSHGRIFYGWYLRAVKTQRGFWYGFLPRAWTAHGLTPLWIQLGPSPTWPSHRLQSALAELGQPGGVGLFPDANNGGFLIPLKLLPGAGLDDVAANVFEQLDAVGRLLDAAALPGDQPEVDAMAIDEASE